MEPLEVGWTNPPVQARLRAYWWWLNGNVTKAAITRDLEEMKAKGFGGALICDAGGAEQDGNDKVPHGPTFFSAEWRELYKHTLREANRLGLEMSLSILSGWNLGGPMVAADDAAKKLVWTEARLSGPGKVDLELPTPKHRDNYYRDIAVVAYRIKTGSAAAGALVDITASSEQIGHGPKAAADGQTDTFWVSGTDREGEGPSASKPEWLQLKFDRAISANRLRVCGRPSYGPRECELQASADGSNFTAVQRFSVPEGGTLEISFPEQVARCFRILVYGAFDPRSPKAARNVQIAEVELSGKAGKWPGGAEGALLQNWQEKAIHKALHFSAPDTTPLFEEQPSKPGEEAARLDEVKDLTRMLKGGRLQWAAPPGEWQVLRFGYTIGDHSRVSTCSDGWQGYALDVLDAGAFQRYWDAVVAPLIADAGPLAGKTLKYLHTDSWEVEPLNWTPKFRQEFVKRRGYDPLPYFPAFAGRIIGNRELSDRFLHDFRKTLGDLAIDNHYRLFRDLAHRHGLSIHPESGGPHAVPIDAQRCLGWDDAPMSEFWAWSWRHRVGDENRFFVKQPASAAHTYGHTLVLAEGFTTIGPHWQETIWDNLKPSFDKAICEGLNLLVWHAFVCSPAEMGMPGQQYFAGTHFNPNSTWWPKSGGFLGYVDRCQFLMQQGLFVADACYYYGDHVPNFAQLKRSDPAHVLPGYDYDVLTEEALLERTSVKDQRLVLPDGMSYHLLVLADRNIISLPVLRKLRELVNGGATVIGPRPVRASGLRNYPKCDSEVAALAQEMWADCDGQKVKEHRYGKGRVVWGRQAREVLASDGVRQDFEFSGGLAPESIDYIHRTAAGAEIYFVANRSNRWRDLRCTFRVSGKAPEFWDPVSGQRRFAAAYDQKEGRTSLPIEFSPCGSTFVVFREPASAHPGSSQDNKLHFSQQALATLQEPWTVTFDPKWGGPEAVKFEALVSWSARPETGIKYYSGTATYSQSFEAPSKSAGAKARVWLDLGDLRELAEVRLNGQNLGVLWAPPFRVEVTNALKPGANQLEVEVVNFWPNRIIGDDFLPKEKRLTRTNIRKLTKETPLMESGLFGPVRLLQQD